MKNDKKYTYTYGAPILVSVALIAYPLVWIGILTVALIAMSRCTFAWLGSGLFFIWVIVTALLFIPLALLARRYSERIGYLKNNGKSVPKTYFLMLVLVPVALLSPVWAFPLIGAIDMRVADSKMDTFVEFETQARNCNIEEVEFYYNSNDHRAEDAESYIRIGLDDAPLRDGYNVNYLYYSSTHKEELKRTYDKYTADCASKSDQEQATSTSGNDNDDYWNYDEDGWRAVNWEKQTEYFNESC